jgi:hypothetical protein
MWKGATMNMFKPFVAVPLSLAGLVAMGCGMDTDADGPQTDDDAVVVEQLASTATEQPLARQGGNGGGDTAHVTPPAVIYGVQTRSGTRVDRITFFYYQPTRADNRYAGESLGSVSFGGTGGSLNAAFFCPGDQSIIGIRGSSGTMVDRIGVICGNVTNPDPFSPSNAFSPLWGGSGGGFFDDRCGVGRLVDSFNMRSGTMIDSIQAICINAR